jgi:hypothetical protein
MRNRDATEPEPSRLCAPKASANTTLATMSNPAMGAKAVAHAADEGGCW